MRKAQEWRKKMSLVNILTIGFLILMIVFYVLFVQNSKTNVTMGVKQKTNWLNLGILLMIGLLVRYILACIDSGYEVDMNCFSYWSDQVFNDGMANFYASDTFTDYPPGYMYVLWVIGAIRHFIPSLASSTILVKMPAILCDLVTAGLVYKIAHKHFDEKGAIFFTSCYLFNPVVLIDSAMWGQVDAVFTLFVTLMCYFIAEKKLKISYFVFAIGILMKPQTLVLTPVLICGVLDQVIFKDFSWEKFFKELGTGLLAIASMFILVLPFGVRYVLKQYTSTLSSYPYATVNGYNFWAMLGKNWHSQTEKLLGIPYSTWGTLFIVLLVAVALYVCVCNRKKENGNKYFFIGAFIACGFFTMSVRVHERYMFPVFALLLLAYLYKPRKELLFAYMGLTVCQVNNIWHAFKFYDPSNFDWEATFPRIIGALHVVMFAYVIFVGVKEYVFGAKVEDEEKVTDSTLKIIPNVEKREDGYWRIRSSEKSVKFTKYDWIAMLSIVVVYGAIALYNLGYDYAPESYYTVDGANQAITFDFTNKQANITELNYYLGRYENREFYLQQSADNVNWTSVVTDSQDEASLGAEASKFTMVSVFCWGKTSFNITEPYVRLVTKTDRNIIHELVFKDENGNEIVPVNSASCTELFDEQEMCPEISTFRDSTYFDEIYHARTAYEMTQDGVYCYENTHPPLGKFIISIGIRIFGMNPFGWRIMGTLIGIAMLPIFYLFTRRFFKETWIATIATTLLAADFMHFTQTRIATIDVFVTFFIILMYYFMYQYTTMSFYDTPLKKTFIPLLCSGISMGLGCASKWPGCYAGIGLAIIFFAVMIQRYMEYRYACQTVNQTTEGIKHSYIKEKFKGNTIKTLAFCVVSFIIIPLTIYTASYIPFDDDNDLGFINFVTDSQIVDEEGNTSSTVPVEDGESLNLDTRYTKVSVRFELDNPDSFAGKLAVKWNSCGLNQLLGRTLRNQESMYSYHSNLEAEHPFSSMSYEWPIMKRPIWYYNQTISGDTQENISAFGNPLVWWAGIPAFAFMIYLVLKERDKKSMFLTVAYLAQFLPWFAVSRCTFIYHYFPSVPFITIMISYAMYRFYQYMSGRKKQKVALSICIGYAVAAVALFALFYPVLSGYPMDYNFGVKYLRWFESWVLVSG